MHERWLALAAAGGLARQAAGSSLHAELAHQVAPLLIRERVLRQRFSLRIRPWQQLLKSRSDKLVVARKMDGPCCSFYSPTQITAKIWMALFAWPGK